MQVEEEIAPEPINQVVNALNPKNLYDDYIVITVELFGGTQVLAAELSVNPSEQVTQLFIFGPKQVRHDVSHFWHILTLLLWTIENPIVHLHRSKFKLKNTWDTIKIWIRFALRGIT